MLGVRLDPKLDRLLTALARQKKTTKSAIAREAIRRYVLDGDLAERARAQSLRASGGEDPGLDHDERGWVP